MSKIPVGKCEKCGHEFKVKAHAVKANLHLTCKYGHRVYIRPDQSSIDRSKVIRNTIEYQLALLAKQIHGKKSEPSFFNFVNAS